MKKTLVTLLILSLLLTALSVTALAAEGTTEAKAENFDALQKALSNLSYTTIKLTGDIEITETLEVSRAVTIVGDGTHTVKHGDTHTGTMFTVSGTGALTLQNVHIDAGGKWSFNQANLEKAKAASLQFKAPDISGDKSIIDVEGGITSTAHLIVVTGGTLVLDGGTKISGFYAPGNAFSVIFSGTANSTIEIKNAELFNNSSNQGAIVRTTTSTGIQVKVSDGAKIHHNYATFNGGLFEIYTGAVMTISGGEIYENVGYNSNGVVCMAIGGEVVMDGGKIYKNLGLKGPNNVWDQVIYVHTRGKFTMNAGEIYENTGCRVSALAQNGGDGDTIVLNGGTIRDNVHYTQEEWDGDSWGDIAIGSLRSAEIGQGFTFGGNVYAWGEGKLDTKGTITGNLYLMSFEQAGAYYFPEVTNEGRITGNEVRIHDGSLFTNGSEGVVEANVIIEHMPGYTGDQVSRFENNGSITGNVTIAVGGNAVNKGNITGNIDIKAGGELILNGDGAVTGNITVYPGGDIRAAENDNDYINGKLTLEYKDEADLARMQDIFRSSGLSADEVEYKLHEHTRGAQVTGEGKSKPASCTEPGYDTYTCTTCLGEFQVELPMTEHTPDAGTTHIFNDCTVADYTEYRCTECSTTWTVIIREASAHTLVANGAGFRCSVCGRAFNPTGGDDSGCTGGHTWNSGTVTAAASCTTAGVRTLTCTVCGATLDVAIPAAGHTWGELEVDESYSEQKPASCIEEGKRSLVRKCTVCGAVDETSRVVETIPMTEHTAPAGTYSDTDGKRCTDNVTFVCTSCSNSITVNGKAHTWQDDICTVCHATRQLSGYASILYQYPGATSQPDSLIAAEHILYAPHSTATPWMPAEGEIWTETFMGVRSVFIGWSETHIVTPYADAPAEGTLLTTVTLGDEETHIFAVWAEDRNGNGLPDYGEAKYTITFNLNNGTGAEVEPMTGLLPGVQYVLPQPTGLKQGEYEFAGWLAEPADHPYDSTHTDHNDLLRSYTAETATDVILYAVYADNTYAQGSVQVHYHANGGEARPGAGITVDAEGIFYSCTHFHQPLSFVPVTEMFSLESARQLIRREGAVLVGWSDTRQTDILTTAEAVNEVLTHGVTMGSNGAVLYAVWAIDRTENGVADYLEEGMLLSHTYFDNADLGGTLPAGIRVEITGDLPAATSGHAIGEYIEFDFWTMPLSRTDYNADNSIYHHYVQIGWSGYVHGLATSAADADRWLLVADANPGGTSGVTYRWLRDSRFQTAYAVWAYDDNYNGVADYIDLAQLFTPAEPSTYPVAAVQTETKEGSVTFSAQSVEPGKSVTVTVKPNEGYHAFGLKVTNASGGKVQTVKNSDGTFSFVMPSDSVNVEPVYVECAAHTLSDLDENAWYHEYVDFAVTFDIMHGHEGGVFEPLGTVTRAQMATVLWNLAGQTRIGLSIPFDDVSEDAWYAEAVRWAVSQGIVTGYSDDTFAPDDTITREQMVTMLYRYALKTGAVTKDYELSFTDASAVNSWAQDPVAWCAGVGIVEGRGGNSFAPAETSLRAELAKIMAVFMMLD